MYWKIFGSIVCVAALCDALPVNAQTKYGPGVSDTEIKIGQTMPYSGPASSFSAIGKAELAYYKMINAQGGINGRKINLISLDDGFSPPKAVEQTRKLVEEDKVLAIVNTMGTAGNTAIAKYLNSKKVPQLLSATSSVKMNDPVQFPWTTTFFLLQSTEARVYAQWLLKNKPDAKIGILYQNDDYGKGYADGMRAALGEKAKTMIVKEVSHELTDATVDSQISMLRAEGADTIFYATLPKATIQGIRRVQDLGWHHTNWLERLPLRNLFNLTITFSNGRRTCSVQSISRVRRSSMGQ